MPSIKKLMIWGIWEFVGGACSDLEVSQGRYVKEETCQNFVEPTDSKLSQGVEEIYK